MKPQVKYGLLVGLASFIIFIVTSTVKTDREGLLYFLSLVILMFGIYFTMRDIRDASGSISFARGLGLGMLCSLVAGSANGLGSYFYCKFINHYYIPNARNQYIDILESSGLFHYSSEQMAEIKKNLHVLISPGSLAISDIMVTCIFGFLISLFVGAIIKKNNTKTNVPGV